jgi:hypothetical protein
VHDLSVIDRFMQAFIRYIDSGFGLLGGDVRFLTATLIGIDITLAGLFWAMGGRRQRHRPLHQEDPLRRCVRAHPEQLLDARRHHLPLVAPGRASPQAAAR